MGIVSIDLNGQRTGVDPETSSDNAIYATSSFQRIDGSVGMVGDVFLSYVSAASAAAETAFSSRSSQKTGFVLGEYDAGNRFERWRVDGDWNREGMLPYIPQEGDPQGRLPGRWPGREGAGESGAGDAAPGKVDRRADRDLTAAQAMAAAMQHDGWRASSADGTHIPPTRAPANAKPGQAMAEQGIGSQAIRYPEQQFETQDGHRTARRHSRSALHDGLALNEKKRFQMVEAMSAFSAQSYAEFGMGTGQDPKAMELLTTLPDLRMTA
ncbi:hypothetical protein [Luteimonas suaedae]|uniref:hypothetical protein n=1 Tax=Luteimonas suaedae TaxID=2605430 RepID=UPI0011EE148C|nr:hypothetical protein [Luteimonas suaedae]